LSRSRPDICWCEGKTLPAVDWKRRKRVITSGSSTQRNGKLAEIVA
jgi:hypothetical protein